LRVFVFAIVFAMVVAVLLGPQSTPLTGRADEGPPPPLGERPALFDHPQSRFAPGQIVVRFREGAPQSAIRALNDAQGARSLKVQGLSGLHRLALPEGADVDRVLAAYRNNPLVEEAGRSLIAYTSDVPNDV